MKERKSSTLPPSENYETLLVLDKIPETFFIISAGVSRSTVAVSVFYILLFSSNSRICCLITLSHLAVIISKNDKSIYFHMCYAALTENIYFTH